MKIAKTPIFFFSGSCNFHTTGIGRQKIKKSVATPIEPCVVPKGMSLAVSTESIAASWLCPGFGIDRIA